MIDSLIDAPAAGAARPAKGDAARLALVRELHALRKSMLAAESSLPGPASKHSASARNLVHYLALRRHDQRGLQQRLADLGLSSLGRAEPHVLDNVDKVLQLLGGWRGDEPAAAGFETAQALHRHNVQALFGPAPSGRRTPIMVTLPSEAAGDGALIPALVRAGMDVARINCAHDDAEAWIAMAARVRHAATAAGRAVQVLMDLAGPKLRTAAVEPGPQVLKLKPQRDAFGVLTAPAELLLCPRGSAAAAAGPRLEVDAQWLAQLRDDDQLRLVDARGRKRRLRVVESRSDGVRVQCERTAYLCADTQLVVQRRGVDAPATRLPGLPHQPGRLHLSRGQTLRLAARGIGRDARAPGDAASVACTLPEVLPQLRAGERVWFDDGRIGGVVRRVAPQGVDIEITDAAVGGETLAADKGINLPDSQLDLPALTDKDLADLTVVARHADLVGLSFVQTGDDVRALHRRLAELCADKLGVVLKIETRRGFENLPDLLFAAMERPPAGVMIARGDLAVECGFERLAEVQEEILWACEAAHLPVVWATQVLENLAKTGRPSRAEIIDAAMSVRADCVMLNKGPHILDAMHTLDDILRRMQEHQAKKRPLLRALKAWS